MNKTNLDMDALRSFVTGIEVRSFVKAADMLGRSTSAISAQLKKLEKQAGKTLVRKSGRGLSLTEEGEAFFSYARRLLALNDEAISAVRGVELQGWIRLGIQEDFGETLLPQVLGRFVRAHPKVQIEGLIARNAELKEKVTSGYLDLALAWDDGNTATAEKVASLPLCWLGSSETDAPWHAGGNTHLPLVTLAPPCILRDLACEHLDRLAIAWRIAFISPSLSGLWAATAAGLGIALRTPFGLPPSVQVLNPHTCGLPLLPSLDLKLHRSMQSQNVLAEHLATIIKQSLYDALPAEWHLHTHKQAS